MTNYEQQLKALIDLIGYEKIVKHLENNWNFGKLTGKLKKHQKTWKNGKHNVFQICWMEKLETIVFSNVSRQQTWQT